MTEMWHFIADNKLRDGGAPALAGGVERWDGPVVLCKSGLHACLRPLDALGYAPSGETIQVRLVSLGGTVVAEDDKAAATERHIIASADCTRVLHEVALHYAESVRHLTTDKRSLAWLDVKRRWLDGKATDDELAAATAVATTATSALARNATKAAARDATRAATAATWIAAFAAARIAASAAAWATKDVTRDVQNAELERRLRELLRASARMENAPEFEATERLDGLPLQFSPNSSTVVTAQFRYAGRWKPDALPIEECEDA